MSEQQVEEALSDERYVANRRELAGGRDLLAELEAAERECELRDEENKRLREAAEYYLGGWNNYDGSTWKRLRAALAHGQEQEQ